MKPTIVLFIAGEACTLDQRGEVITAEVAGDPLNIDWEAGGVADPRGAGGAEGYEALRAALESAEKNAALAGFNVERIA